MLRTFFPLAPLYFGTLGTGAGGSSASASAFRVRAVARLARSVDLVVAGTFGAFTARVLEEDSSSALVPRLVLFAGGSSAGASAGVVVAVDRVRRRV